MKIANKIVSIGRLLMVLGSILYVVVLTGHETNVLVNIISAIYAVAIILMLAGRIAGRKDRKSAAE